MNKNFFKDIKLLNFIITSLYDQIDSVDQDDSIRMDVCSEVIIHNVKFHFQVNCVLKILEKCQNSDKFKVTKWNNYFVVKHLKSNIVYTIFPKSNFIHVTGCKSFTSIGKLVKYFNKKFESNIQEKDIIVDNSTASGQLNLLELDYIDLKKIKTYLEDNSDYKDLKISIFPRYFPALILRNKNRSTVMVFSSGKFTIVGSKNLAAIDAAKDWLCVTMNKALKMNEQVI